MRSKFGGRLGVGASLLLVLAVAALASACSMASLFYPPDLSSFDVGGSFSIPRVLAHGTATIRITSGEPRTIDLPHLSADEPAMYLAGDMGVITWRGGDWSLRIDTVSSELAGLSGSSTQLTIGREDTDRPLVADGSNCTITPTSQTADRFAGTATCKSLVWGDATSLDGGMDLPAPSGSASADGPPFDATITFEATP